MAKPGEDYTVLIADDEPEVVNLVRMMMEMEGYTILEAANGQKTVDMLQVYAPDLILLDVRMPRMSGLAVLDYLASDPKTADIPVIMLSVVTTYPEVRQALRKGAVAYLSKPFELRELVRLVGQVLAMDASEREALRQHALESVGKRWP
jgi:CheY-like chemotaxis protein